MDPMGYILEGLGNLLRKSQKPSKALGKTSPHSPPHRQRPVDVWCPSPKFQRTLQASPGPGPPGPPGTPAWVDHQASHGRGPGPFTPCFKIYPTPLSCDYVRFCEIMSWDVRHVNMSDRSKQPRCWLPCSAKTLCPSLVLIQPSAGPLPLTSLQSRQMNGGAGKIWKLRDQSWKLNK